jgi:hypothetical protein
MERDRRAYAYCVIEERKPQTFDIAGVGGSGDQLRTVHFKDLAAVVGRPPGAVRALSRAAAITHEQVIERVMERYAVLPMSFGVVAQSPMVLQQRLLRDRYGELKAALDRLRGKVELDLKAYWRDMEAIFREIAVELGVGRVQRTPAAVRYANRLAVGEQVAQRLQEKRDQEAAEILTPLTALADEVSTRERSGDRMVCNHAFLVRRALERTFDAAVADVAKVRASRLQFKYVVSPPYHFVNLRVSLS